ncbi:MAG: phosphatidylglycerol lysyltransferase domain-containing protein [Treponema sp.]|nr:phosphatidylglycerol lysyltransferase domain-containing protein [Treponema sp.]
MEYKIDDDGAKSSLSLDFKPASLSALEDFQHCAFANDFFANNYSALNCFLYQKKFSSKVCLWKDWLLELYETCGKFCFSFPHNMKGDYSSVIEVFELLYDLAKKAGQSLYFHNVTKEEKDLLLLSFPGAIVTEDPDLGDYIYLREKLALLSGKKFSKKRNHIHQFEKKYPDYEFELLSPENLSFARQIEESWLFQTMQEEESADLLYEKEIINTLLDNFSFLSKMLSLSGGLLFVNEADGQKKAISFCISSRLSKDVTDIHFEKCLWPYDRDGGYALINREFAKTLDTTYINREEDLGIEGLRKAKLSYYPEMVLEKFKVEIKV